LSESKRRKHLKKTEAVFLKKEVINEMKTSFFKKTEAVFLKKEVINEMKTSLWSLYTKNKKEMSDLTYNFEFNKNRLRKI